MSTINKTELGESRNEQEDGEQDKFIPTSPKVEEKMSREDLNNGIKTLVGGFILHLFLGS